MTLDSQMAAVLLRLELVSHGNCQAWNASGGHSGEPDDRMVAMVGRRHDFPHLEFRRLYDAQWGDTGRRAVIAKAEEELEAWTHNTAPPPDPKKLKPIEDCIIEEGEGWDAEAVARRFEVAVGVVLRIRKRREVSPVDGLPPNGNGSDALSRTLRARELHGRGLSLRQIAMHLQCGVATVKRDLAA